MGSIRDSSSVTRVHLLDASLPLYTLESNGYASCTDVHPCTRDAFLAGAAARHRCMAGHSLHREIVASVANLKCCLRALAINLGAAPSPASCTPTCISSAKAAAGANRAASAAASLKQLLCGARSDQVLQVLPPETSRRLVEINLPDSLQQLLAAITPGTAEWPLPPESSTAQDGDTGASAAAAAPAVSAAAAPLAHPLWPQLQLVVADCCECLSLLSVVALCAYAHNPDSMSVLHQIIGQPLMAASAEHLSALQQEMARATPADDMHACACDVTCAAAAARAAARMAAALVAPYSMIASAAGEQVAGPARKLHGQLAGSCISTGFLAAACGALVAAAGPLAAAHDAHVDEGTAAACETASTGLLALLRIVAGLGSGSMADVSLDGGGSAWTSGDAGQWEVSAMAGNCGGCSGGEAAAGEKRPDSCCHSPRRSEDQQQSKDLHLVLVNGSDSPLGTAGRTPSRLAAAHARLGALAAPDVLMFMELRLHHALHEMSSTACAAALAACRGSAEGGGATAPCGRYGVRPLLLPGRSACGPDCAPGAALCVLLCWQALLQHGPREARAVLSDARRCRAPALLAAALAASSAQAGGRVSCGGTRPELLNMRCMVTAADCLDLVVRDATASNSSSSGSDLLGGASACLPLLQLLPGAAAAAAGAAAAASAAWDAQRRGVRGHGGELPYSGQVKCAERGAAEALRCYAHAACKSADAVRAIVGALQDPWVEAVSPFGPLSSE